VADYAAALLRRLQARGEIKLAARSADVHLYHLGNNQLHAAIYRRALAEPGIVVLHDAVLHHFLLGTLSREEYISEFAYNYGEWARGLAETLWKERARSAADRRFFEYPMLRRVCEVSCSVIVHNPAAVAMVRRHAPKANIVEIPHLFENVAPPAAAQIEETRQSLGITPRTVLFGIFGHLRESKRILPVLRAFRRLAAKDTALLLAGDCGSRDLERALQPLLADPKLRRVPYTGEAEFRTLGHATDICVNLRYPTAGETSGITVSMMGIGKPVIVTDGPEVSRLPQSACVRVPAGLSEASAVEEVMRWLAALPQDGREIGAGARLHVATYHDPDSVAGMFWQTLEAARS
jgi:glycosyltransferase involved in cell wall biosynthesis